MKTNYSNTMITESTAVKSNPENKKEGMSPLWQSVLVGGVPGILIGAGSTIGYEAIADTPRTDVEDDALNESLSTDTATEILEAHSVNDDMSFSEAFASARAEVGAGGAFVWHGQVYGTYRADDPEWVEMTAEDRVAHSQEILSQVHAAPYTPAENESEIIPIPEETVETQETTNSFESAEPTVGEKMDEDGDVDVHILGVGEMDTPYGPAEVGVAVVDDHRALFADTDGDDMVDTVLIDINDNNLLDRGEVFDATDAGISMDEIRESVEPIDPSFSDSFDDSSDVNDGGDVSFFA